MSWGWVLLCGFGHGGLNFAFLYYMLCTVLNHWESLNQLKLICFLIFDYYLHLKCDWIVSSTLVFVLRSFKIVSANYHRTEINKMCR